MADLMQEKIKIMQNIENDVKKRELTLKELQNNINTINTIEVQAKVCNTKPLS